MKPAYKIGDTVKVYISESWLQAKHGSMVEATVVDFSEGDLLVRPKHTNMFVYRVRTDLFRPLVVGIQ
jgi:hypothetical protein